MNTAQRSTNCTHSSCPPPPRNMGARFYHFWAGRPSGPAGWLALLLLKTGDVETNPGNRSIDRTVHKLPKHTITLTYTQVEKAIQHSKNNNLVGPDNLSIGHLKHIGPLGLTFLTS